MSSADSIVPRDVAASLSPLGFKPVGKGRKGATCVLLIKGRQHLIVDTKGRMFSLYGQGTAGEDRTDLIHQIRALLEKGVTNRVPNVRFRFRQEGLLCLRSMSPK